MGFVLLPALFLAGCLSESSNFQGEITKPRISKIYVCSGFDCAYKTAYPISEEDREKFVEIMEAGSQSPAAEREAVRRADSFYENRASTYIGARDKAKSDFTQSREKGQMDCIDESTNTRSLLLFLEENGLLKYHRVERNVSRGIFLDGRYPHSTAVLTDPSGKKWAVDSWYEPTGGLPDVMPLSDWMKRGVMGER
jgi:hypothetical protein